MSEILNTNQTDVPMGTPTVRNDERYLLRIKQLGEFSTKDDELKEQAVRGELHLSITDVADDQVYVTLEDFGLIGASVPAADDETGLLSFRSRQGTGTLQRANEQWHIELSFLAEHVSEQIERTFGFPIQVDEHGFNSPREIFKGVLTGDVFFKGSRTDELAGEVVFELHNGQIQLDLVQEVLGTIQNILIEPLSAPVVRIFSGRETGSRAECQLATPKRLRLQPVGFQDASSNTTGQSLHSQQQFVKALEVWGKACISFIEQPIQFVSDAQFAQALATPSSETEVNYATAAGTTFTASEGVAANGESLGVVDVFFVADPLINNAGAVHLNGNSALAKIVLTEQNQNDPCLLAHELGHVFGGLHADVRAASISEWKGDEFTVMEGAAPHPEENSEFNCINANNAALLETLDESCCMTPDKIESF